ncbi:hypothetical protein TWF225_003814 [Orbilia oligospora]|nr:hypothetical protein TWF225_003814 [Orbilia oligospora]KAF3254283.1 hypothetical protein TWF217_007245 [Orbilia oligospora]KAF3267750.1 hypothetical protein TWF128_009248 [Orbilia oligospora]
MKIRFFAAATLAFLYASPVLGVALANPYPQDTEVTVDGPDGEVVDITESTPEDSPPQDENPPEEPPQDDQPEGGEPAPPSENAEAPPAPEAEPSGDQAQNKTENEISPLPEIPGITMNLGDDGQSAIVQAQTPGADAEDTSKAAAEGANALNNLGQLANTVAEADDAVAKSTDIFEMTITFTGPRGKLESNIGKLPQTNGRLDNLNVCQAATMAWVDEIPRETVTLSMGKTERLGTDALAFRDPDCESRIDIGDVWPPENDRPAANPVVADGDRYPVYYKLMGLTEGQLFGLEPLADELDTNIPYIPPTAPLDRKFGGVKEHTCHSELKDDLNYDEVCTPYNAKLCVGHPVWDEVLLNETPNYIWLHIPEEFNGWHYREAGADKWSAHYDYTYKFFQDEGCETPLFDSDDGPVQFTLDTAWRNQRNITKIAVYLLDAKMPHQGWWRGSRKKKSESSDNGHHEVDSDIPICQDPAHCTPPPLL